MNLPNIYFKGSFLLGILLAILISSNYIDADLEKSTDKWEKVEKQDTANKEQIVRNEEEKQDTTNKEQIDRNEEEKKDTTNTEQIDRNDVNNKKQEQQEQTFQYANLTYPSNKTVIPVVISNGPYQTSAKNDSEVYNREKKIIESIPFFKKEDYNNLDKNLIFFLDSLTSGDLRYTQVMAKKRILSVKYKLELDEKKETMLDENEKNKLYNELTILHIFLQHKVKDKKKKKKRCD